MGSGDNWGSRAQYTVTIDAVYWAGLGPVPALCDGRLPGTQKPKLSLTNLGCQLASASFQGTTLPCLGEMHDLRSTITQVIALGE